MGKTKQRKKRPQVTWRATVRVCRRAYYSPYYQGVLIRGWEIEECPHRHQSQETAQGCAEDQAERRNNA